MALTSEPYRTLVDQSVDAIVLGRAGRVVLANTSALNLLGLPNLTRLSQQLHAPRLVTVSQAGARPSMERVTLSTTPVPGNPCSACHSRTFDLTHAV